MLWLCVDIILLTINFVRTICTLENCTNVPNYKVNSVKKPSRYQSLYIFTVSAATFNIQNEKSKRGRKDPEELKLVDPSRIFIFFKATNLATLTTRFHQFLTGNLLFLFLQVACYLLDIWIKLQQRKKLLCVHRLPFNAGRDRLPGCHANIVTLQVVKLYTRNGCYHTRRQSNRLDGEV